MVERLMPAPPNTTDTAPHARLRFDGLYIAEEYVGKMNDFVTGALVDGYRRIFFRFYAGERVFSTSHVFPVAAPPNPMFTPEKVFVKLGQLDPARAGRYIVTDDNLSFGAYEGVIDGLSLLMSWSLTPDPYSGDEGEIVTRRFHFLQVPTQD